MASSVGPQDELPKPFIFLMANWWWIWGKLTMPGTSRFFLAESAHETGFLKVRELPCWEFGGVCDLEQEQESERFHHKKRDSGLMILGRIFTFCHWVFLPITSCDLWGNRKCALWSTKAHHGWVFKGTKKVEVVGDSHLYQSPLIICLIRQHLSSLQNWW